jgi:hypothetical protein
MPAGSYRRPPGLIRPASTLIALGLLCAGVAGCSTGDLGRARDDVLNDDMHRWVGVEAAQSTGRRASDFQLTDGERTLRDLAYAFIEPPHSHSLWKGVFGEYDPIASPWRKAVRFDRTMYGRHLIDEPHRSHASRYAQVIEDVRDDTLRLDQFYSTAAQVADFDQKRNASLKFITDLSPRERADAVARMKENALVVQWVGDCLQQRIASYHWALERLVVQGPDAMAAEADRLISDLSARAAVASQRTPVVAQILTVKG